MKAIHTQYTTVVLGAPKDWDEAKHGPCAGLPVCVSTRAKDDQYIYSWWRLSWRERIAVLLGRPVKLCIVSMSHPPVALAVAPKGEGWAVK